MTHRPVLFIVAPLIAATLLLTSSSAAHGQNAMSGIVSPVDSLTDDIEASVQVFGDFEETLTSESAQVHLIVGRVSVSQGGLTVTAAKLAMFVSPSLSGFEIAVYGEDVTVKTADGRRSLGSRAFRLQTLSPPVFDVTGSTPASTNDQPILRRAISRLFPAGAGESSTVSFQTVQDSFAPPLPASGPSTRGAARRLPQPGR